MESSFPVFFYDKLQLICQAKVSMEKKMFILLTWHVT